MLKTPNPGRGPATDRLMTALSVDRGILRTGAVTYLWRNLRAPTGSIYGSSHTYCLEYPQTSLVQKRRSVYSLTGLISSLPKTVVLHHYTINPLRNRFRMIQCAGTVGMSLPRACPSVSPVWSNDLGLYQAHTVTPITPTENTDQSSPAASHAPDVGHSYPQLGLTNSCAGRGCAHRGALLNPSANNKIWNVLVLRTVRGIIMTWIHLLLQAKMLCLIWLFRYTSIVYAFDREFEVCPDSKRLDRCRRSVGDLI